MKNQSFKYKLIETKNKNLNVSQKKPLILDLLISLEKDCYEGGFFYLLMNSFRNSFLKEDLLKKQYSANISKIRIDVGDVLNRHNWYYRYCEKYMLENNLKEENQIPKNIQEQFHKEAYQKGKEQGREWFKNNINAINQLIPEGHKLNKDFKISNGITTLYEGDKNNPKIEYICYEYWLKHPKYKTTENVLKKIMNLEESGFKKALDYESEYFCKRIAKGKNIQKKFLFLKQTKKYIFDETIPIIIKKPNNILEFYFGGRDIATSQYFAGRKAQNNPEIKKLMEKGQPLEGADQRKFVSVKLEEKEI